MAKIKVIGRGGIFPARTIFGNMDLQKRKSTRIPNFDYSQNNYYFVTVCTHEKACIFSTAGKLNQYGMIAKHEIEKVPSFYRGVYIDIYVVMPNHIHAIIILDGAEKSLSEIIGSYKAGVTRMIRQFAPNITVWQRSFHDHIIRNEEQYQKIWNYVKYNDQKWENDCYYVNSFKEKGFGREESRPYEGVVFCI